MKKCLCLSLVLFVALPHQLTAQTTSNKHFFFIMDASGSMWEKMGSTTRIQEAKKVMTQIIDDLPSTSSVGLVAYGHRQKAECGDIETLIPIQSADKALLKKSIQALDPKGKTPIAKSILHTLNEIAGMTEEVTVILISDGLETCEGDACAIVKQARLQGTKLVLHVVGFGIKEDVSSLECLAQAGGGLYIPAENADQLSEALEHTIKAPLPGHAWVSVKATLGGSLKDATVTLTRQDQTSDPVAGRTYAKPETNPRILQVPAGTYSIEVIPVGVQGQEPLRMADVLVTSGDTLVKEVDFSEGTISVLVTRNGQLSDATLQLFPVGSTKAIATSRSYTQATHNPSQMKVPPGTYDLVLKSVEISGSPAFRNEKIELAAGAVISVPHDFPSGEMMIGATQNGQLIDATLSIIDKQSGESVGAGRTYTSTNTNPKQFILTPGKYTVEVKPVKPAGLAMKSIEIVIEKEKKVERIVEW